MKTERSPAAKSSLDIPSYTEVIGSSNPVLLRNTYHWPCMCKPIQSMEVKRWHPNRTGFFSAIIKGYHPVGMVFGNNRFHTLHVVGDVVFRLECEGEDVVAIFWRLYSVSCRSCDNQEICIASWMIFFYHVRRGVHTDGIKSDVPKADKHRRWLLLRLLFPLCVCVGGWNKKSCNNVIALGTSYCMVATLATVDHRETRRLDVVVYFYMVAVTTTRATSERI